MCHSGALPGVDANVCFGAMSWKDTVMRCIGPRSSYPVVRRMAAWPLQQRSAPSLERSLPSPLPPHSSGPALHGASSLDPAHMFPPVSCRPLPTLQDIFTFLLCLVCLPANPTNHGQPALLKEFAVKAGAVFPGQMGL